MARFDPRRVRWSLLEVVIALGLYCAVALGCQYVNFQGFWPAALPGGRSFQLHLVHHGTLILIALFFVIFLHRQIALRFWFPGQDFARDFAVGLQVGLIFAMLAGLKILQMRPAYRSGAQLPQEQRQDLTWKIYEAEHLGEIVLLAVAVGVLAPLAEEVFFRGFVYPGLRRQFGVPASVLFCSAFFALFHVGDVTGIAPLALCYTFLLSVIVTLLYEYSGSLIGPILAHAGWNMALMLLLGDRGDIGEKLPLWFFIAALLTTVFLFFFSSKHFFAAAPAAPAARAELPRFRIARGSASGPRAAPTPPAEVPPPVETVTATAPPPVETAAESPAPAVAAAPPPPPAEEALHGPPPSDLPAPPA